MKRDRAIFSQPVACEILGYFISNPNANDTVEGLVEWRLLEQRIRHSIAEAESALTELVAGKLILARRGADGRIHYRVNPAKETEILERLKLKPPHPTTTRNRLSTEKSKS
ncbi:MAG: hypothetical protein ABI651_11675 [Verrucomicrobiota bacterium]